VETVTADRPVGEIQPDMTTLPADLVTDLRSAVAEGDMARFTELLSTFEGERPPVARQLRNLAESFDYDRIDTILGRNE
jgi:hypothetical protein